MTLISKLVVFKKNIPGIWLLLAVVMFDVTAYSSARINGMQPPAPMSRDAERRTSKMRAWSSVSATLTMSPVSERRSNYEVRFNDVGSVAIRLA